MLFSNLIQLFMPRFIFSRTLYEIRERPSRTYSWKVFILSSIIAEIPGQTIMAVVMFVTWYYPLGMYQNTIRTDELNERGVLMLLLLWSYTVFCSTFSQMIVVIMPDATTGVNVGSALYTLALIFCG